MDEVAHTDNPSTGGVVAGKSKVKVKVGTSLDHGRLTQKKKIKQNKTEVGPRKAGEAIHKHLNMHVTAQTRPC